MRYTADAVVIGAGVIGCSIALELSRAGHDVVVVDKAGGIGHGSTSASSAIVRFHYSTWTGVAAAWESVHCWQDWAGHLGYVDPAGLAAFTRTGMLVVDGPTGPPSATTSMFDRAGVPWEAWGRVEFAQHLPQIDEGSYGPPKAVASPGFFQDAAGKVTGTFTPDAGYVDDPQLAAQNLGVAAQHHGASFLLRREVHAIESAISKRWKVVAGNGDQIEADVVINAAGPWSSRINALAGADADFTITTRPLRQEVHQVPVPGYSVADGGPGIAIADPDLGIYLRPASGGTILVGGMEPECDPLEWVDDPDGANHNPTLPVFEAQVWRAARRLPALQVPNRPIGLAGLYDASTDWTPIYDRTALTGFYVAIGTSGNQFKNAPLVGQLMRQLVEAVESGHDHDADPLVFKAPRTGNELNLATYSRLRPVGSGAPASVMG